MDWQQGAVTRVDEDVVVIGAGPYGLASAAHLHGRRLSPRVFGDPLSFWADQMPEGMWLRSAWGASSISDPQGRLSLDVFDSEQPTPLARPLPRRDFVRYGRWFAERQGAPIDRRMIATLERSGNGFELKLEAGDSVHARRVVVATGLRRFPSRPAIFEGFDRGLVEHAVDVKDLEPYAGLSVAVIGAGQSAVETATLAAEAGASVELIGRAEGIRWLTRSAALHRFSLVQKLLYAPTDVGPPGLSWVIAMPNTFRRLPSGYQEKLAYRSIRPAAAGWLVERSAPVRMTLGRAVTDAQPTGSRVRLTLDDGSVREVDRVILCTGYKVDVAREPMVGSSVMQDLRVENGYPVLRRGFESSVPGLHFVGAYSAPSYSPVMRFVSGTPFAARSLAAHIARVSPRRGPRPVANPPMAATNGHAPAGPESPHTDTAAGARASS
jgi:cation diffusion facilitator CzcD-associated flavoprotein CzcO